MTVLRPVQHYGWSDGLVRCYCFEPRRGADCRGERTLQISKLRLAVSGVLTATAFSVLGAGTAYAVQEHMFNARNNLQQGLAELQQADPDKGGHREQAINLVQQAIDQVNQGIQYAQQHPNG
jgi:hypothetical protein